MSVSFTTASFERHILQTISRFSIIINYRIQLRQPCATHNAAIGDTLIAYTNKFITNNKPSDRPRILPNFSNLTRRHIYGPDGNGTFRKGAKYYRVD